MLARLLSPATLLLLVAAPEAQEAAVARPELHVLPVSDPGAFTGRERRIDFELLSPGTPLSTQFAHVGVEFERYAGRLPTAWLDGQPRSTGTSLAGALCNAPSAGPRVAPHALDGAAGSGLRVRFTLPVNRAGFDLRSTSAPAGNALLTCKRGGRVLDTRFFDVSDGFGFVGLESTRAFDEILLEFTNPRQADFSVDDLRYELDLRDRDRDGAVDFVDTCPGLSDPLQEDSDGDGRGDACDPFPLDARDDEDGDGIGADLDNCPSSYNPEQGDVDGDGVGDACDTTALGSDSDEDGVPDASDNCPSTANPAQTDCDMDGIGDVCDDTLLDPQELSIVLGRGQSYTLTKSICLPPSPPRVDIVIAVDCTGSMGGEIAAMRANLAAFAVEVRHRAPDSDIRFGLVNYRDYPASYSSCGYGSGYGGFGDFPYQVLAPIGTPDPQVLAALGSLAASGGADGPESYSRVLWEMSQPGSGIGFRPGARRVVLNVCDNLPHDCDVRQDLVGCSGLPVTTGSDPGRDGLILTADDVDFQSDALAQLDARRTKLFTVYSNLVPGEECAWRQWSEGLGGAMIRANSNGTLPAGTDLVGTVLELIADPFVDEVVLDAGGCDLDIVFDPPIVTGPIDVTMGAQVSVQETITVPADLPAGVAYLECAVRVLADGVLIGIQRVRVDVDCASLTFEGLANGERVAADEFASQGVTLTLPHGANLANFGLAAFDSTPDGPNAAGPDPDLLVGTGNVLIFQENGVQSIPGVFDVPDDAQLGGTAWFDFATPSQLASIDLVDVDHGPPVQDVRLVLVDADGRTRAYAVPEGWTTDRHADGPPGYGTLDLTTLAAQPGFESTATATEDPGFDGTRVTRLVLECAGSAAVDNLVWCAGD